MELNQPCGRPSTLPAAGVPETHASVVGRFAVWAPATPGGSARLRVAAAYRTSGSADRKIAGNPIPVVNRQFTGDVRGVPPRGRPV